MRIVVLDGYTLNPGDLDWGELQKLGDLTIHERSAPDKIIERSQAANAVLVNKVPLSAETIQSLPDLRYIGVTATGYNIVDVETARERGIAVCNVPTYGTRSVAQMAFAHVLEFTQRVAHHDETVRIQKRWASCPDFCYWDYPLIELEGLTIGIVGLGRIGQATAEMAQAFGMHVVAYSPSKMNAPGNIELTDLDDLFRRSDVVSLHCPLTPESDQLVNTERLAMMKPTALLINTSRGALVDVDALADALNNGVIAGAGLDVLPEEPPPAEHPLYSAKNCRITPHIAWATRAARARLMQTTIENLAAFVGGTPQNVVNM